MAEIEQFLKEKTEEISRRMGLPSAVSAELSPEGQVLVNVEPEDEEDTPLLIGFHGQTLNALQSVLRTIAYKEFDEVPPILVETGGYRKSREEELRSRAQEAADKARFLLKEVSFPAMSSYERRVIHTVIGEEKGVRTESRGEGRERHVVVIPEGTGKE